jgi:hypothetical protein
VTYMEVLYQNSSEETEVNDKISPSGQAVTLYKSSVLRLHQAAPLSAICIRASKRPVLVEEEE